MGTTYLVWQNPSCAGVDPQWENLTRNEFLTLVNSPDAIGRYFIKLNSTDADGADGRIVIEATEEQYKEYEKERQHASYLKKINPGYIVTSYHAFEADNEDLYGEDLLCDVDNKSETEYQRIMERFAIDKAIEQLSSDERDMITFLYLSITKGTEAGYSALTGIPQKTINNHKKRILRKLQIILEENG